MNSRTGRARGTILLALTVAVVAAALLVAGRFALRLDLSSDRQNSLSSVSLNLYREIPERLHLSYYITPSLSDRHPGPRAVEDLLREFEASSHGKIDLRVEDPTADAGAVEALGVQGRQMQVVERNEQRVAVVYSGIVLEYLGRSEVIPFVLDATTLEYDLVKAVRKVVKSEVQKVAVLVGDGDKSLANDYKELKDELARSGWEVAELNRGDPVPPDAKALLVLGNADLDDYDVYRVDDYLTRGGAVFAAVKGVGIDARQGLSAFPLRQDALLRALAGWGVEVGRSLVLESSTMAVPFQEPGPGGNLVIRWVPYPHFVVARQEFVSKSSPVTAKFAGLSLYWPSPLSLKDVAGVKGDILVRTTPKAWLQTSRFAISPEESAAFSAEADKTKGQYGLVASLQGAFPDVYAGRVPERSGAVRLEPIAGPPRNGKLIVVGSSDFATDLMANMNSTFNAAFIATAVDWLAVGDELAAIKARGARDPKLSKILDPELRDGVIVLSYAVNIVLVPGALLVFAWIRRRKRRQISRLEAAGTSGAAAGEASK